MEIWQSTIILIFGTLSALSFYYAFRVVYLFNKSYTETPYPFHLLYTSFVWGDHVVFGAFWTLISLACLYLNDWILFLLIFSLFRLIRSGGEVIYWFLQQFSQIKRDQPEKYILHKIFKNDSVYFVHQAINQCYVVVFTILTLYFAKLWLTSF